MFNIKISIPTYKVNSWKQLDKQGEIQISSEVDSLSDGYAALKMQVNELLAQVNAENEIVVNLQELGKKIERREATLKTLNNRIQTARTQLEKLEKFLKQLKINPAGYSLEISNHALESATNGETEESITVEAEVDPIPFDSADSADSGNYHEF